MEIIADGKTYILSTHAQRRMKERKISKNWIIQTIERATRIHEDMDGNDLYYYIVTSRGGRRHALEVVVDEPNRVIVTVMFTR